MKTVTEKCVECGQSFEHHAAWEQDTCKKCRRRISSRKNAPKYYAKNREAIAEKYRLKTRDNRMAYVKPQKGVIVYQPGQFEPDHYTKCAFVEWLKKKQFLPGTVYVLDGVEHRI